MADSGLADPKQVSNLVISQIACLPDKVQDQIPVFLVCPGQPPRLHKIFLITF
jgi:hypothetical protein